MGYMIVKVDRNIANDLKSVFLKKLTLKSNGSMFF